MKDMREKIGERIIVIGSPGSGKSTFARQLAEITGIKLIHLDKEFWQAGWVETPEEIWRKRQEALMFGDQWIIDGNYNETMDIRLAKADTVIFFDLSRVVCVFSYLKRVITNLGKVRPDMPAGCIEKIEMAFIQYIWNFPKTHRPKIISKLESCQDKQIIIFKRRSEAKFFLKSLDKGEHL